MPELSDERINQLLSEAEGRLATTQQSSWSGKENKTAVAVSASRDVAKPADVEGPPRPQSQQRLTVRDVRPTELKVRIPILLTEYSFPNTPHSFIT